MGVVLSIPNAVIVASKTGAALAPAPHGVPESLMLPEGSNEAQLLKTDVNPEVAVATCVVLPVRDPENGAPPAPPPNTGRLAVSDPDDAVVVPLL